MLNRNTILAAICLGLATTACSDSQSVMGPSEINFAKGGNKKLSSTNVVTASTVTSETTAGENETSVDVVSCTATGGEPVVLRHRAGAPSLRKYQRRIRAVQGRNSWLDAYYADGTWFMSLQIPPHAQLLHPDGSPAADGEAVTITATFDTELFEVSFGPHGSSFEQGKAAKLQFSLEYAEIGGCDPANASVWYQPTEDIPWEALATTWNVMSYWVETDLYHFSNYSVAW